MKTADLPAFVDTVRDLSSENDYAALMARFGFVVPTHVFGLTVTPCMPRIDVGYPSKRRYSTLTDSKMLIHSASEIWPLCSPVEDGVFPLLYVPAVRNPEQPKISLL